MNHPYRGLPDERYWSRSIGNCSDDGWDPVTNPPFQVEADARIITAGSCFAQHLARYLNSNGRTCFVTESSHPLMDSQLAKEFNYGIFTARYGNIYTSRQLLQLWQRANFQFVPKDSVWTCGEHRFDPFRPSIQPGGFASALEFELDQAQHFAAVRRAFSQAYVLVFTLGLTECWASKEDGAVYPIAPGVLAGEYDPNRHELLNLSVDEVVTDIAEFVRNVRISNPAFKLILTVSPVPLAATAEARHVGVASCYSKAVLRIAAEYAAKVAWRLLFPSYELITAPGQTYFAADRRSIREEGVRRVMSLFFRHVLRDEGEPREVGEERDVFLDRVRDVVDVICEESLLDEHK